MAVNDIRSQVAYLQGLAEGLDLDTGSPEGRVLSAMLDVLADIAEAQTELAEYVEDVDYDLGALEETLYGDEDDEVVEFVPSQAFLLDDEGVEMAVCPDCGETLAASAGDIDGDLDVVCPSCGCSVCDEYVDDLETVID
ncbi:MAG: hypothetical protein K0R39_5046 [Symbiobacteriaceae bacterium]|jgi:hypothetical protein|nr:hypothetical protein [Symbiobacteriaceae bacterium]